MAAHRINYQKNKNQRSVLIKRETSDYDKIKVRNTFIDKYA